MAGNLEFGYSEIYSIKDKNYVPGMVSAKYLCNIQQSPYIYEVSDV
jgi:hypothetical protein